MEKRDKKSETLLQREKARKDFLELKKMQQENAQNEKEHIAYSGEKKPTTFKEKLAHFWYYYKTAVVIGAVIIGAVLYITLQTVLTPKSDLKIIVYDSRIVPDMYLEDAKDYFKNFCKDYNNDGKINISIINCSFEAGSSTAQYQQTMQQRLNGLFVTDKEAMLIITSDTGYEYLQGIVDTPVLKEEGVALSEDFYNSIKYLEGIKMPDGLKLYSREIKGTLIEDDEKAKNSANRAEEFLSAVK